MKTLSLHRVHSLTSFLTLTMLGAGLSLTFAQAALATPFLRTGVTYPTTLEDERIICSKNNGVDSLSTAECREVARDFYREIYFQVNNFTPTGAFEVIRPTSIELFPDGSGFTKGIFEAGASFGALLGGNFITLSIENAFGYQPIDRDTVVFIGAPLFTVSNGTPNQAAYIHNVQMSVYRRIAGTVNDPNCRSGENIGGNLCWALMSELWSYQMPLGAGMSSTSSQVPPPSQPHPFLVTSDYPEVLEGERIICDDQSGGAVAAPEWAVACDGVAREFYKQFSFDLSNYTAAGRFDTKASISIMPDGSGYVNGLHTDELFDQMVLSNTQISDIKNAFAYKPTDKNTVIVLGAPLLTLHSDDSLVPAFMYNMQLSVYRRTNEGLQAPETCRSASNPHGNTCWVMIDKLWTYQQALGSKVFPTP